MGAAFKLEHANIMAFVTSRSYGAPRLRTRDLAEFLDALAEGNGGFLIPAFEALREKVSMIASHARETLPDGETLTGAFVEQLLDELRSELSVYPLFALAVGTGERLREVAHGIATSQMHSQVLVLIPEQGSIERNFEVLDPIPAFSVALHAASDWPGILFWTTNGVSAFAPLDATDELTRQLMDAQNDGYRPFPFYRNLAWFDAVLRRWTNARPTRSRRLLHLSDLHFGTRNAEVNLPILEAQLRGIVKSVDRVVITGDLCDAPKGKYATIFTAFQNNITSLAGGRMPISITGNHDQRRMGMFGDNYKHVALICSTKIIVDDHSEMIFLCFNSSVKGRFARGKITKLQFSHLGAEYLTLTTARPELNRYLPIVLVHHHPFSFAVEPETWMQKVLSAVGLPEETFLQMVDAEELHHWCVDWKIQTILHGHKHKARYVERQVARGDDRFLLTAIGCGSSLGAEGFPVSYNMLEWDVRVQRWVASYYESVNGGAFREIAVSVSPERTTSP